MLVYNQDFINDNFMNYGDLKGAFIFGEEDIEAKKKIAELTDQKNRNLIALQLLRSIKENGSKRISIGAVSGNLLH